MNTKIKRKVLTPSLLASAVAMGMASTAAQANELSFETSTTVSYIAQMRTEDPTESNINPDWTGLNEFLDWANTGFMAPPGPNAWAPEDVAYNTERMLAIANGNDGNRNFEKNDLVQNRLSFVTDLSMNYGNMGAFVRAKAWYDAVYQDNEPAEYTPNIGPGGGFFFSDDFNGTTIGEFETDVKRYAGQDAELLDAYVFGFFDIGNMPASIKIGRQVINWGEGMAYGNGISSAINPGDALTGSIAGVEVKEVLRPTESVLFQIGLTDKIAAEVFYQWKHRNIEHLPSGNFMDEYDFLGKGSNSFLEPFSYSPEVGAEMIAQATAAGIAYGTAAATPGTPENDAVVAEATAVATVYGTAAATLGTTAPADWSAEQQELIAETGGDPALIATYIAAVADQAGADYAAAQAEAAGAAASGAYLATGVLGRLPVVDKTGEVKDGDEYGLALRYFTDNGSEFALFAIHAHSKAYGVYGVVSDQASQVIPGFVSKYYEQRIQEGVNTYGASFQTVIGETQFSGEISHRHNGEISPYAGSSPVATSVRAPYTQAQVSMIKTLNGNMFYDSMSFAAEVVGWQYGKVRNGEVASGEEITNKSDKYFSTPHFTPNGMGAMTNMTLSYKNVFLNADLDIPLTAMYGIHGTNYSTNVREGGFIGALGATLIFPGGWETGLNYTMFKGKEEDDAFASDYYHLHDRDSLAVNVKYTF